MWIDAATVRKYNGWPNLGVAVDSEIDSLIIVAATACQMYTGRSLATLAGDILLSGTGAQSLVIRPFARTVTAVYELASDNVTWNPVTLSDVVLKPDNPSRIDGSGNALRTHLKFRSGLQVFTPGEQNYKLTGTFGFQSAPLDYKHAIAATVKHIVDLRGGSEVLRMDTSAGRSVIFNNDSNAEPYTDLPRPVKAVLSRYKVGHA